MGLEMELNGILDTLSIQTSVKDTLQDGVFSNFEKVIVISVSLC